MVICNSGYAAEVASIVVSIGAAVEGIYGGEMVKRSARHLGIKFIDSKLDPAHLPEQASIALAFNPTGERETMDLRLTQLGQLTVRLVRPDATVGAAVTIGVGSIVSPGARVTADVHIGCCCLIHTAAVLSHDSRVANFVNIGPSVTICGGVTIGDHVTIGAGATVLPNLTIGAGSTIGAGAVVVRSVEPGLTVAGVPARYRA